MLLVTVVTVLVAATTAAAAVAAGPEPLARVDGNFTIEWRQMIASADRVETAMAIADTEVAVRPLPTPKAKNGSKERPRAALFVGDGLKSRTLIHPGKWYHFALVGRAGTVQLFVNGFPDGDPVRADVSGDIKPAVKGVETADRAMPNDEILVRFARHLPPGEITVVAHRGVHKHAPENTRISYVQALEAKAPMVEIDTALTRDGVIVLMHDDTVDRTTNGTGAVAEMLAADIVKLDAGSWKDERYAGEPVPLLADIAELCRGRAVVMLDLKAEGQGKAIADWLAASKFPRDQVILAPWTDEEGVALRKHVKDVPMVRLTSEVPTDQVNHAYFAKMKQIGFSGFSVSWEHLTQAFVDGAQANGMAVHVWTVNDDPDVAGAALLGVDGIITDDAAATMKTLARLADAGGPRKKD
jgi:glycerophosphoryl diester phosphodiesterase